MLTSVESQLSPISEFSLIVERMMPMGRIESDWVGERFIAEIE